MRGLESFEKLARLAREDVPPEVDVAGRVLDRVTGAAAPETLTPSWPLAVGVSVAAAASVFLAAYTFPGLQEPFAEFLNSAGAVFI